MLHASSELPVVLRTSDVTDKRYVLTRVIGQGGMAKVYEAMDIPTGKHVVIKFPLDFIYDDAMLLGRYIQETELQEKVNHPNVVQYLGKGMERYHDGPTLNENFFHVMEYFPGEDLAKYIANAWPNRLGMRDVFEILDQILAALEAIHERGIVHRDLKPDNFLCRIDEKGKLVVKLTDFGIAKILDVSGHSLRPPGFDADREKFTMQGQVLGTLQYLSPEQAFCKPVNHRSDLFAFGVIMVEILTGLPPIDLNNVPEDDWRQVVFRDLDKPFDVEQLRIRVPNIHPDLEKLICDLQERDPANRPQTAAEIRRRLNEIRKDPAVYSIQVSQRNPVLANAETQIAESVSGAKVTPPVSPVSVSVTGRRPLPLPPAIPVIEGSAAGPTKPSPSSSSKVPVRKVGAGILSGIIVVLVAYGVAKNRHEQTPAPIPSASTPVASVATPARATVASVPLPSATVAASAAPPPVVLTGPEKATYEKMRATVDALPKGGKCGTAMQRELIIFAQHATGFADVQRLLAICFERDGKLDKAEYRRSLYTQLGGQ